MRKKIRNPLTGNRIYRDTPHGRRIIRRFYVPSLNSNRLILRSGVTFRNQLRRAQRMLEADIQDDVNIRQTLNRANRADLARGDFSGAQRMIREHEKFTNEDIQNLKRILLPLEDQHQVIKVTLNNDTSRILTLSRENLSELIELLKHNYYEVNESEHGSDAVEAIMRSGIKNIELYKPKKINYFKNKAGAYFKYLNTTDIDLSRYQIINKLSDKQEKKNMAKDNCLTYALNILNIEKDKINNVKLSVREGSHIAKKNLVKVSDTIGKTIILHYIRNNKNMQEKQYFNKGKYNETIDLAIYQDHFFIYEKTNFTVYASKHYEEIKDLKDYNRISGKIKKKYVRQSRAKKCDSLTLIKNMFEAGNFVKDEETNILFNKPLDKNAAIPLENISEDQHKFKYEEKKTIKKRSIFLADTETDTTDEHQGVLAGIIKMKEENKYEDVEIFRRTGPRCTLWLRNMFDYVVDNSEVIYSEEGKEILPLVYFHNLKYDYHVMLRHLYLAEDPIEKDGALYSVKICHANRRIELRDSQKLINMALKKFNKTFDLPKHLEKKEAIAYNYYKIDNMYNEKISISEYKECLSKHTKDDKINETLEIFDKTLQENKELFEVDGDTFNPVKYYEHYLVYDCLVLCEGLKKFKEIVSNIEEDLDREFKIKNSNKLDLFNFLTISSLSNAIMEKYGAFDGLYKVSGNLREFISRSVTGGRVQCLENKKLKTILKKIADYDGVSLYPSAIDRLCKEYGLAKGKAKKIDSKNGLIKYEDIKDYDYYTVRINIKKINKKQQLPFVCYKDEEGILRYTNHVKDDGLICYIDKYTLEDWIEYQKIEFDIIKGVYWNNGYNKKMGEIINVLFNKRLYYKQKVNGEIRNNAMQQVLKLMMNSAYGKTIIKKTKTEKKIFNEKNKDFFIKTYYPLIKEITQLNNKQYCAKLDKYDESKNLAHVGTSVLSMSKRIMNEVFNCANDKKLPIYYTDTDSMHLNYEDVPKLEKAFKKKYKRELTGKTMGQFHIDFDLKGTIGDVHASKSLFLGKKCYIDKLEGVNEKGEKITGYHMRMKGVPEDCVKYKADKDFNGDVFKLYETLAKEKLEICLNPPKYNRWEYVNNYVHFNEVGKFTRTLNFCGA